MERAEAGRFAPGSMTPELREKISKGQTERHRRQRATMLDAEPVTKKKCSNANCRRAGQWLQVPEDFYMRRRKLKSGGIRIYPSGECKECSRARADAWIAAKPPEERKKLYAQWNAKRDRKKRNRYQREHQRLTAIEEAEKGERILRGPWKRYRDEPEPDERVPARGFIKWYVAEKKRMYGEMSTEATRFEAKVNGGQNFFSRTKWRDYLGINGETLDTLDRYTRLPPEEQLTRTVSARMVDRILTRVGQHHLFDEVTDWRRMA